MTETKMTETQDPTPSNTELSLPWYATGKLTAAEAEQMRQRLAERPELERQLRLALEEQAETIGLNETLGAPSRAAHDRLFARIDAAEAQRPLAQRLPKHALDWLAGRLSQLSPRGLAWSAVAAGLAICLQAGVLASLLVNQQHENRYRTASLPGEAAAGTYLLIAFTPDATTASVTTFLESYKAVIADGPKPGGLYRIRIGDKKLSTGALNDVIAAMRAQTSVVRFILPEPPMP